VACSGSVVHSKMFLFSVRWFIIEISSNKNVLQKRYQRLVEWDGDRAVIFWSTITSIICINSREGLPRPPSQMLRRWRLPPITLSKDPPYLWPLEKGWSSFFMPSDTGLPVGPRILTWYSDPPTYLLGSPIRQPEDAPDVGYRIPHTGQFKLGKNNFAMKCTNYWKYKIITIRCIICRIL
jgi:hypothetical protein